MAGIADLVIFGKEIGIFQFYIPFVLLFTILYGLLQKSKIFGEKAKGINVVISLAASAFILEYALAGLLQPFLVKFVGTTMGILVGILGFLMITYLLLAVVGGKFPEPGKYVKYVIIISALLAVAAYITSGGTVIFPGIAILPFPEAPTLPPIPVQFLVIIGLIVLLGVIILYVTREKEKPVTRARIVE